MGRTDARIGRWKKNLDIVGERQTEGGGSGRGGGRGGGGLGRVGRGVAGRTLTFVQAKDRHVRTTRQTR